MQQQQQQPASTANALLHSVGCVVIGRNEGARLVACLESLAGTGVQVVYVDSGSTDSSIAHARHYGAEIVELPMDQPFTAARARNAGFSKLLAAFPTISFVQFVDGDCRVACGWLEAAARYLSTRDDAAIVFGHRREIKPDASLYNALCDIEWATPIGDVQDCGGDFMIRTSVFSSMRGFHESLIAGEEPELCHRITKHDWHIAKIDQDMTYHDANITTLGQWRRRVTRSGYAYLARAFLHVRDSSHYCWRENGRIAFWAFAIPLAAALGVLAQFYYAAWILLLYPIQILRMFLKARKTIQPDKLAFRYSAFQVLGKFFEFAGQLQFVSRRVRGSAEALIEYK